MYGNHLLRHVVYILSIASATPDHCFRQTDIMQQMLDHLSLSPSQQQNLKRLYQNSDIETRYSVMKNYNLLFDHPKANERNAIFKKEAPKLAIKAARKAIDQSLKDPKQITHVISVSCTGMIAPGIEYYLIKELGLNLTVERIGINFMGCFGAFNGLSVAKAIISENPHHCVLLVCTELCSLHGQLDLTSDTLLGNSIFGDGAAACVLGGDKSENYLWEITERASLLIEDTADYISWEVAESGYKMKLSSRVPVLIKRNISGYAKSLLKDKVTFEKCHWAIHPGGKSILQAVEKGCSLMPQQIESSRKVLENYGNMSSATFLFVLEHSKKYHAKWTIGMAFGPGLSIEGILLRAP